VFQALPCSELTRDAVWKFDGKVASVRLIAPPEVLDLVEQFVTITKSQLDELSNMCKPHGTRAIDSSLPQMIRAVMRADLLGELTGQPT
jgi:hypothetical protein